jgi:hypothetical protein
MGYVFLKDTKLTAVATTEAQLTAPLVFLFVTTTNSSVSCQHLVTHKATKDKAFCASFQPYK